MPSSPPWSLIAALALAVTGCGGGEQGPAAAQAPPRESWFGQKPPDPEAARMWQAAIDLYDASNDGRRFEDFNPILQLAFNKDTLPLLVGYLEHGDQLRMRAAWYGLRSLVEGIGSAGAFDGDSSRLEAYRPEAYRYLGRPDVRRRITAALDRLQGPSRAAFEGTVAKIPEQPQ